tara:strand:- start:3599 stop:4426 length:828 start_codon:yes stop_codon:yes gene_type:complete
MSNKRTKESLIRIPETLRKVKNIFGVFSAKGGVGKSEISLNLAISLATQGHKVGLLDADIYGPSQHLLLSSADEEIDVKDQKLLSPLLKRNIKFISMGLIAKNKKPVIWRGPMVSGAVMQLMSQTDWQELDFLIIDTPPGTGDIQLTLLQKLPIDGALILTTPQEVSISDTKKGIEMIKKLDLPIIGLIENMSYFQPNDSDKKYFLFGRGGGKKITNEYNIELLSEIPLCEKEEIKILYDLEDYKCIFDNISSKIIEHLINIKRNVVPIIPQKNE